MDAWVQAVETSSPMPFTVGQTWQHQQLTVTNVDGGARNIFEKADVLWYAIRKRFFGKAKWVLTLLMSSVRVDCSCRRLPGEYFEVTSTMMQSYSSDNVKSSISYFPQRVPRESLNQQIDRHRSFMRLSLQLSGREVGWYILNLIQLVLQKWCLSMGEPYQVLITVTITLILCVANYAMRRKIAMCQTNSESASSWARKSQCVAAEVYVFKLILPDISEKQNCLACWRRNIQQSDINIS